MSARLADDRRATGGRRARDRRATGARQAGDGRRRATGGRRARGRRATGARQAGGRRAPYWRRAGMPFSATVRLGAGDAGDSSGGWVRVAGDAGGSSSLSRALDRDSQLSTCRRLHVLYARCAVATCQ